MSTGAEIFDTELTPGRRSVVERHDDGMSATGYRGLCPCILRSEGEVLLEQKQCHRVARSFGGPSRHRPNQGHQFLCSPRFWVCCWRQDDFTIVGPDETSRPVEMPAVVSISRHLHRVE
jgi:hypothetical protein